MTYKKLIRNENFSFLQMKNLTLYLQNLEKEKEIFTVRNPNLSWTGFPERQRRENGGKGNKERDPGWEFSRSDKKKKNQFINSKSPRRINKKNYTPDYITMRLQIMKGKNKYFKAVTGKKKLLSKYWWLTSQ